MTKLSNLCETLIEPLDSVKLETFCSTDRRTPELPPPPLTTHHRFEAWAEVAVSIFAGSKVFSLQLANESCKELPIRTAKHATCQSKIVYKFEGFSWAGIGPCATLLLQLQLQVVLLLLELLPMLQFPLLWLCLLLITVYYATLAIAICCATAATSIPITGAVTVALAMYQYDYSSFSDYYYYLYLSQPYFV